MGLRSIAGELAAHVATTNPAVAKKVSAAHLVTSSTKLGSVQALTVWLNPGHAIAVNVGLSMFVYQVARVVAPYMINRGPSDDPPPSLEDSADRIAHTLDSMASLARAPMSPDWSISEREIRTAENTAKAAERFVLAHEFGHIVNDHLITNANDILSKSITPEGALDRPLEQELVADITGIVLSSESLPDVNIDIRAGFVGALHFLRCLGLAEQIGVISHGSRHLPGDDRLSILFAACPDRYGDHWPWLSSWAIQLDEILRSTFQLALERLKYHQESVRCAMDAIFATHTPASGPDRDLASDDEMREEVLTYWTRAPGTVLECLSENLLTDNQMGALGVTSRELLATDAGRRHSIAHYLARNLGYLAREALGVKSALEQVALEYEAEKETHDG